MGEQKRGLGDGSWEQKRGLGDGSPTAGSKGRAPVEVWGRSHQKRETHAEYSTEQSHKSSQIAYCSESDYTLKKFPATTGDMTGGHAPMSPCGRACTHVPCMSPLATPLFMSNREDS